MPSTGNPQRRFLPFLILLVINALLAAGCGSGSAPAPTSGQSQFLSIAITSPTANSTVSGTVMITARVTNPRGELVDNVEFMLDAKLLGRVTNSGSATEYSLPWDTTASENGSYNLRAIALFGNNQGTDSIVRVTVGNELAVPTIQLSPQSATVLLGDQLVFSLTSSGIPQPMVECGPAILGSLALKNGSITYTPPSPPPADFSTNNVDTITCTASNSVGSDSVLVTINLEYPVPEITSITAETIFCPRECIVVGIKITGSGFYGGGVLHDNIFADLILAAGTDPNEISINPLIGTGTKSRSGHHQYSCCDL